MASSDDFHLQIPRSVADALALPEGARTRSFDANWQRRSTGEEMLSFGKARELAGLSKYAFGQLLGERSVERHYGPEELEEDLRYARGDTTSE